MVVDWDYLSRQTFGDGELEKELLTLFQNQADRFAGRLAGPAPEGESKERSDMAHTLKGSARAIGAFELGAAVEAYETALNGGAGDAAEQQRELEERLRQAQAAIKARLERR